ncbi:MAG: T9SS type A sorting domain-containing protein, partial [Bacteroidetes bacterium]|nr:T9SS type A sorting domain-containing protein [Bacteroidota bacterium]
GVTSWKQVSAGESYAMLLSENGRLFTWGENSYGRLGVDSMYDGDTFNVQTVYPVLLPVGMDPTTFKFTFVVPSFDHTLAIGNDGNLYSAGSNTQYQAGQSDPDALVNRMTLIPKPNGSAMWVRAAAGRNYSVGLMSDGALYRIGVSPMVKFLPADGSDGFTWKDVTANDYQFYALGSNGVVYVSSMNLTAPHVPLLQPLFMLDNATFVAAGISHLPRFELDKNYPNPFNPRTSIGFTLRVSGTTTLKIYDAVGRLAVTLVNEHLEAGVYHQRSFDGSRFSSGVYYARLISSGEHRTRSMLLMK